jgi:hypothetical protein
MKSIHLEFHEMEELMAATVEMDKRAEYANRVTELVECGSDVIGFVIWYVETGLLNKRSDHVWTILLSLYRLGMSGAGRTDLSQAALGSGGSMRGREDGKEDLRFIREMSGCVRQISIG